MLLSLIPAYAAEDAATENYSQVVAKLSDYQVVSKTGMKASTEHIKSGSFTALIEGELLKKNFSIPVTTSDFSKGKYIEMYVYSPEVTSTAVGLLLHSDNPSTPGKDFYYVVLNCDFQNWKHLSTRLDTLKTSGTPQGLNSIDSIQIIPGYGGSGVAQHAKLFFDDIVITSQESEDANYEEKPPALEPFVVWTAEENGKGQIVEIDGVKGMKWGPGKDALLNGGPGSIKSKPDWDLSKYANLVFEM